MSCATCGNKHCTLKPMLDAVTLPHERPVVYAYSAQHCDDYRAEDE